jgi:lipopolysaccharide biosynthesis protein
MSLKSEFDRAARRLRRRFGRGGFLAQDFSARMDRATGQRAADYVAPDAPPPQLPAQLRAQLVAYYLPQFHVIPENSLWWGRGFTEWTNVARAVPQFLGHYQPRLPGELGFYDLTTPGVMSQQVALAKAYGVTAFCFHYYWFSGKRLLERPLDMFLADRSLDINFCLCWANENWTRRWDGEEGAVLMAQSHSPEDDIAVFHDLARYMEDPRCLRVDGKPMILLYRPGIIPNVRDMIERWRSEALRLGWPGLYIVATNAFDFSEAEKFGFDALVEFPPHQTPKRYIEKRLWLLNRNHCGEICDYRTVVDEAVRRLSEAPNNSRPTFPGVMPSWDNEARRPGGGRMFHNSTPALYGKWLKAAIDHTCDHLSTTQRFVFINAWNEWAEGAYLEPDQYYGRAYLQATAGACF